MAIATFEWSRCVGNINFPFSYVQWKVSFVLVKWASVRVVQYVGLCFQLGP